MSESGSYVDLRAAAGRARGRIAMDIADAKQRDIWIYDWQRDTLSRFTFDLTDDSEPLWSPDGRRIAFSSKRGDGMIYNIYWQFADGTGQAQRLTESKHHQFPNAFSPDGKTLVFNEIITSGMDRDLMVLKLEGDDASGWKPGKPTVFLSTPFEETNAALSPDGAWLAYDSKESGQSEVCAPPPVFFTAEKPRLWAPARFTTGFYQWYDLHPEGQRFAVSTDVQSDTRPGQVVFVFNFSDELRRLGKN
jgi:dipeptidyl aminopeptidase/acylaminoacyl peptidase